MRIAQRFVLVILSDANTGLIAQGLARRKAGFHAVYTTNKYAPESLRICLTNGVALLKREYTARPAYAMTG
ncbi:hypothetical protein EB241_09285 [Erwinia psidii]|uniref:Uncharacterized protein n=1 Tax=Erwinia psidii TaxID=69224 RepID=A0A3N6RZ11_9GAMM|nr:hypothetical protein EB241_09285 [Erwinia psidii]